MVLAALPVFAAPVPTFEKDVRPILKAHCFDCHGEGETPKGGLDLRLRRLIVQGGEDGPAIVPGKPEQSSLLSLVIRGEMPKRDKKLTPQEIAVLRKWIASGARTARPEPTALAKGSGITEEERAFWSFQPITSPKVPKTSPSFRARTAIDSFLAAPLAKKGLKFSPEADKITQLRRIHLDLTGLPPTPAEVVAFVADRSADAYERRVDELLNSEHYGERWGRHWLDVIRFAESNGFETNRERTGAWRFRDWVIQALNRDLPYDEFVRRQIAGDASGDDVATGFLVGGPWDIVKSPDPALTRDALLARFRAARDTIEGLMPRLDALVAGAAEGGAS
jgi:hypothetical protein